MLKVSRSGYYRYLSAPKSNRCLENEWLSEIIKKEFHALKGIYGARRIKILIERKYGKRYNLKRIKRLMRKLGITSSIRRKRKGCTKSGYSNYEENVLGRDFTAKAPNEKWVTDVTYLEYGSGQKAYLSAVKDQYDGYIVSFEIGKRNDNRLVMRTLEKAFKTLDEVKPLLHSDRGYQYTSKEYVYITSKYGVSRSMSRVAKCLDNAPMESFCSHFKVECYSWKKYKTYEELVEDINDYIEFYNTQRYQTKLNSLTPEEYRNQAA